MASKRARFEKLAMPVVDALYRQAMKLTNNPDDAQDLVQDTFERGFKAFDSFQEGTNFAAWMTTIERNAYFNQYAKAKRRPQRANESTGEQGVKIGTVMSRLNRARTQLKRELANYAKERGYATAGKDRA